MFFERRVVYITEQMQKLQPTLQEKYQSKEGKFIHVRSIWRNYCTIGLTVQNQKK